MNYIKALFITLLVVAGTSLGYAQVSTVSGVIYHDANLSSCSFYEQTIDAGDVLLPDIEVFLLENGGEFETTTGDDGRYLFSELDTGTYFVDPVMGDHECTSGNWGRRTAQAIREGAVHIVSLGDSIGAEMFPDIDPYPPLLGGLFAALAETVVDNIHVGGSASWQWLPGAEEGYFENLLLPLLPDADIVTITLGGNDLAPYVEGLTPPYDVWEIIQRFFENPEYALEVFPRIQQLLLAIQEQNPDCDIVMVIYPNFANSTIMQEEFGALQPLMAWAMELVMTIERHLIAGMNRILMADMIGALGDTWMDPYIVDEVHPTQAGSQLYADEIFKALGGVVIDENWTGADRLYGFDAPDLIPADDDTTPIDDDTTPPDDDTTPVDDDTTPTDDDTTPIDDDTTPPDDDTTPADDDTTPTDDDAADDDIVDDDTLDDDTVDDDVTDDDAADDDNMDDDAADDDTVEDDDTNDDTGDDDQSDADGSDDDNNQGGGCGR